MTVAVTDGQQVQAGELVLVVEAMRMEQPLVAHRSGTVTGLAVGPGGSLKAGAPVCDIA